MVVAEMSRSSLQPYLDLMMQGRMEKTAPEFVVVEEEHDNLAILRELEKEREKLLALTSFFVVANVAAFAISTFFIVSLIPYLPELAGRLQALSQRVLLMRELIENFEAEGIQIYPGIEISEQRDIDLFLKFPNKEFILIHVRSLANSIIVYNERLEAVQIKRKGRGLRAMKPDPLSELSGQELWLRKQRPDLFGDAPRDRKRSMAKLLVLWDDTDLADHSEHLYATINDQKYLTIRRTGTTSIVRRRQVVDFIRDYLASRRSLKTP